MSQNPIPVDIGKIISKYSNEQASLMIHETFAIQPTLGCSIGCYFCGLDAPVGVRAYITPDSLDKLVREFEDDFIRPMYDGVLSYYASEPLDYDFEGVNFFDLLTKYPAFNPEFVTAVPRGKEKLTFDYFLRTPRQMGKISISPVNLNRLEASFKSYWGELDNQERLSFSHKLYEEELYNSITPFDFNQVPDLFRLRNVNLFDKERQKGVLNPVGKLFNGRKAIPVGCYHGVLITPEGFFNVQVVEPSPDVPTGEIRTLISPDSENFFVYKRKYMYHHLIFGDINDDISPKKIVL